MLKEEIENIIISDGENLALAILGRNTVIADRMLALFERMANENKKELIEKLKGEKSIIESKYSAGGGDANKVNIAQLSKERFNAGIDKAIQLIEGDKHV